MKILMINHFPLAGSGSGTYTRNLAVCLAKLGHQVTIILPENTADYEKVPGVRLHPVFFSAVNDKGVPAEIRRACGGGADQIQREVRCTADDTSDPVSVDQNLVGSGRSMAEPLPFNFPCFTTHPRSTVSFGDLTDEQLEQYEAAFSRAIDDEIRRDRPDIIHGQHVWILPALAARRGIPLVLTAHGTDLMGYSKWPDLRKYANLAMEECSAVISISKDNCELIRQIFPYAADKTVMMRNGYDPSIFYPEQYDRTEVLESYGISKEEHAGRRLICFAGKLAHFKGVDVLLDALRIIDDNNGTGQAVTASDPDQSGTDQAVAALDPDQRGTGQAVAAAGDDQGASGAPAVFAMIAGDGEERDMLRQKAEDLALKHVRFIGNVSLQELRKIYSVSDVSTVPSRREPFGLVALEAMACGTPVVASDQGGLPDFVDGSVGALFKPEDAADLSNKLIGVLQRLENAGSDGTAEWRKEIAGYARTHYAQDTIIRELDELYKRVLNEH